MSVARVMAEAEPSRWASIPYGLPPVPNSIAAPQGRQSIDCSLYVLAVFAQAGIPFQGVRTAEQIRQAIGTVVAWGDVRPGDLLFFERTYQTHERATHIGISHGAGSAKMFDARERSNSNSAVGLTLIGTDYWQTRIIEARRPQALVAPPPSPLPSLRDRVLAELDASRARIEAMLR
jgi:cell wall-associated NlpC family hydrolase